MLEKEVPVKNYIKYAIIVILTLTICIITFIVYNNHKDYENNKSVLRNKVPEITVDDIDNYISENEESLLYFGVVNDDNSKKLESDLLELIEKNNFNFVYINLTDVKDKESVYNKINSNYSINKKINAYPAFVYIKNGKMVDLVQKEGRDLYIGDISQLLDVNEIKGENDA